jgi:hypothetical protein
VNEDAALGHDEFGLLDERRRYPKRAVDERVDQWKPAGAADKEHARDPLRRYARPMHELAGEPDGLVEQWASQTLELVPGDVDIPLQDRDV